MASMDIDDLIASFKSSSSISQEANDLAKLQAQLSASLMRSTPMECPTTPTMTSSMQLGPEQSYSHQAAYGQVPIQNRPRRGTMVPSRQPTLTRYNSEWERQRQAELEDEREMEMVESSLLGGSGADSGYHHRQQNYSNAYCGWNNSIPHSNSTPTTSPPVSEPSSYEAYAAIDPFFAAQLQNSQQAFRQQRNTGYGFPSSRPSAFASS
ncbi:hypothetical protein FRB94_007118 [Tulasnella sp. JGI-2019a]|nr:hypothetical protein FRB93_010332 [Tulasnella sp. JGI-2019a]KAG9015046.1 hypothetical protein FRB94_007118 [Tulasnella sp. JGI-2019a]KAG9040073.1 hypothetical protein FRB95_000002 [Tulasnella sp. JGI-2019a]